LDLGAMARQGHQVVDANMGHCLPLRATWADRALHFGTTPFQDSIIQKESPPKTQLCSRKYNKYNNKYYYLLIYNILTLPLYHSTTLWPAPQNVRISRTIPLYRRSTKALVEQNVRSSRGIRCFSSKYTNSTTLPAHFQFEMVF